MKKVLLAVAALMFGTAVRAENAATTAATPPAPAPELKQNLDVFAGKWSCTGRQEASPMGPAHATKSKKEANWDLGGYWLSFREDGMKTKEDPMPKQARVFLGFDATTKRLTGNGFFPGGGAVTAWSSGWDGNKMVWTGDMMMGGQKTAVRHIFEKVSDTEMHDVIEGTGPDGKTMKMSEGTCKKGK